MDLPQLEQLWSLRNAASLKLVLLLRHDPAALQRDNQELAQQLNVGEGSVRRGLDELRDAGFLGLVGPLAGTSAREISSAQTAEDHFTQPAQVVDITDCTETGRQQRTTHIGVEYMDTRAPRVAAIRHANNPDSGSAEMGEDAAPQATTRQSLYHRAHQAPDLRTATVPSSSRSHRPLSDHAVIVKVEEQEAQLGTIEPRETVGPRHREQRPGDVRQVRKPGPPHGPACLPGLHDAKLDRSRSHRPLSDHAVIAGIESQTSHSRRTEPRASESQALRNHRPGDASQASQAGPHPDFPGSPGLRSAAEKNPRSHKPLSDHAVTTEIQAKPLRGGKWRFRVQEEATSAIQDQDPLVNQRACTLSTRTGARGYARGRSQCQCQRDPSYIGLGSGNGRAGASPVITSGSPPTCQPPFAACHTSPPPRQAQPADTPSSQHSAPQAAAKAKANAKAGGEVAQLVLQVERAARLRGSPSRWTVKEAKRASKALTLWWHKLRQEGITWGRAPAWKQPQRGAQGRQYPSVENMLRSIGAPPHAALVVLLLVVWQTRPRPGRSLRKSGPGLYRALLEEQLKLVRNTGTCDLDEWPFAPTLEDLLVCWNQGAEPGSILQERLALAEGEEGQEGEGQVADQEQTQHAELAQEALEERARPAPDEAPPAHDSAEAEEEVADLRTQVTEAAWRAVFTLKAYPSMVQRIQTAILELGDAPTRQDLDALQHLIDKQYAASTKQATASRKAHNTARPKQAARGNPTASPPVEVNPAGRQEGAPGVEELHEQGAAPPSPCSGATTSPPPCPEDYTATQDLAAEEAAARVRKLFPLQEPEPDSEATQHLLNWIGKAQDKLRATGEAPNADALESALGNARQVIGAQARAKQIQRVWEMASDLLRLAEMAGNTPYTGEKAPG